MVPFSRSIINFRLTDTSSPRLPFWDAVAILLLTLASLPATWLSPRSLLVVPDPGKFDDHWILDTPFKASHGLWFGRDVAFPYGPLFQWLCSEPSRWIGVSMASVDGFDTLLLWCTFLFVYLTLRLLLPEQPAWKRILLLILLCVFWAPWDGRTAFDIFLLTLFLRGWYALREERIRPVVLGFGAALLCAVGFLYSADTGMYAIAGFLISLAGVALESRHESNAFRRYAFALLDFTLLAVVLVLSINAIMAGVFNFRFWKSSLALVAVYRWNEPVQLSVQGTIRLFVALLAAGVVFLLRLVVPGDRRASIVSRMGFLLSAFVFAVFAMQSGLIRCDPAHIAFAIFPMVSFTGAVLLSFPSRAFSAIAALAAIICSVSLAQPAPVFRLENIRERLARMRTPLTDCPMGFSQFDGVCYPAAYADILQTNVSYLQQHTGPQGSVVIFPYQYLFGIASGRNVAGGVLQSLIAAGPYLTQLDIAGMEKAAAPAGLYFPDGMATRVYVAERDLSLPVDNVPNFTRSPEIWLWIFQRYRSEQQLTPGVVALKQDDSRLGRISMQPQPLGIKSETYKVRERITLLDLGEASWPDEGADFLRLRMTVRYRPWWKLRKPERLTLVITRSDGSQNMQSFVLEPNRSSEVWFYPWTAADLGHYFDEDGSRWRTGSHPAIAHLRLWVAPLDWVSQQPDSISIDSAEAIKFSMQPKQTVFR
jgi:hypothetical protein